MSGRPQPRSLQGRMRAHYEANPDAALTFDEAAALFNAPRASILDALRAMRTAGILRSVQVSRIVRAEP